MSKTVKRLRQKSHLPQGLVDLLGRVAELQLDAAESVSITLPEPDFREGSRRVARGGALLTPDALPVDPDNACSLFSRIIEMIAEKPGEIPEPMVRAAEEIGAAVKAGTLDLRQAACELLAGEDTLASAWAERTPDAPDALRFLVLAAIQPSLGAAAETLATRLREEEAGEEIRRAGTCPICGSLPHLLELREKEGVRFAACSLCRHEYRVRRMACPVCDTTDTDKMKFFTVVEEPGFRVETCGNCGTYMKTVDFRSMDGAPFLPLNDLESLALDFLAAEQGFTRAAPSVWGI